MPVKEASEITSELCSYSSPFDRGGFVSSISELLFVLYFNPAQGQTMPQIQQISTLGGNYDDEGHNRPVERQG